MCWHPNSQRLASRSSGSTSRRTRRPSVRAARRRTRHNQDAADRPSRHGVRTRFPLAGFVRDGDSATGPGVVDDKGGIVVILAALRGMKEAGTLEGANIVVALTGDEEDAGEPLEAARRDLVAAGNGRCRAWLRGAVAARWQGCGRDRAPVFGQLDADHQREAVQLGIFSDHAAGAIYEMAHPRRLPARRLRKPDAQRRLHGGRHAGGAGRGPPFRHYQRQDQHHPSHAVARGDLRALTPAQNEATAERMRTIVADHLPGTEAEIVIEFRYPPMAPAMLRCSTAQCDQCRSRARGDAALSPSRRA